MIKSLRLKGFTVFREAEVTFAPGINIIIGENGFGKSHLLKLAYCSTWFSDTLANRGRDAVESILNQRLLGQKLVDIFKPDSLGRLASRGRGRARAEVAVTFQQGTQADFSFSFATNSKIDVSLDLIPKRAVSTPSVFMPTKEMISMYPGFAAIYRDYHLQIDETYYDLCLALERPLTRGPKEATARPLLQPIEKILEGKVVYQNGRFVLRQPRRGNMEMPLVAEGFRKLATVAYLIANGTLRKQAVLYWDEPETNLNARYIRKVADTLVEIATKGTQVIAATHSLFLLREIELLLGSKGKSKVERQFIALGGKPGAVVVSQGTHASSVNPILALDEEIDQSDRYLRRQGAEP